MSAATERLKVLTAGVLSLVLMLGIARFAYTPLLPLMQQQAGLGIFEGGWLAAINYMGYLSGAVILFVGFLVSLIWVRQEPAAASKTAPAPKPPPAAHSSGTAERPQRLS